jgi:hypothetical protein
MSIQRTNLLCWRQPLSHHERIRNDILARSLMNIIQACYKWTTPVVPWNKSPRSDSNFNIDTHSCIVSKLGIPKINELHAAESFLRCSIVQDIICRYRSKKLVMFSRHCHKYIIGASIRNSKNVSDQLLLLKIPCACV